MKEFLNNIVIKIKNSFKKAWQGQENYKIITHWWGILPYLTLFFIFRPIMIRNPIWIIDLILAAIIIIYFILHIILLYKNKNMQPELSEAEKKHQQEIAQMSKSKRFARKLFLQEPVTKWRPGLVFGAIDILIILEYYKYLA
jgi:hypothetical protein